jgi:hydrogenase expression/formation protein HypC
MPGHDVNRKQKEHQFMCLAIPGKVLRVETNREGIRMGRTNFGGVVKQVCLEYTPEVGIGDYVLVHVGFALGKVDEAEAARTYSLLEEMKQLSELDVPEFEPAFPSEIPP